MDAVRLAGPRTLFDLTGKVALVTGANSGIGLAYARAIARHGGDLVLWGRRAELNDEVARELRERGARVLAQAVDVSEERQVVAAMAEAVAELGRIDCVVANAGVPGSRSAFHELRTEDYRELMAINLDGAFHTLREGVRHMVERGGGGSIVVTGSITALLGRPTREHYAASKAGVVAMTRGIAVEYAAQGIRANVVAAGFTLTGLSAIASAQTIAQLAADVPMKRFAQPEDIAGVVVYLMSDAASFHTGDVIVVDGGRSIA